MIISILANQPKQILKLNFQISLSSQSLEEPSYGGITTALIKTPMESTKKLILCKFAIILFNKVIKANSQRFSNFLKCSNLNIFNLTIKNLLEGVLRNVSFFGKFLNRNFTMLIDILSDGFNKAHKEIIAL